MIVLHKTTWFRQTEIGKRFMKTRLVESFSKPTTIVPKNRWLNNYYFL